MMLKNIGKKNVLLPDNSHIIKWYFSDSGQVPLLTILLAPQNYFDLFLAHLIDSVNLFSTF